MNNLSDMQRNRRLPSKKTSTPKIKPDDAEKIEAFQLMSDHYERLHKGVVTFKIALMIFKEDDYLLEYCIALQKLIKNDNVSVSLADCKSRIQILKDKTLEKQDCLKILFVSNEALHVMLLEILQSNGCVGFKNKIKECYDVVFKNGVAYLEKSLDKAISEFEAVLQKNESIERNLEQLKKMKSEIENLMIQKNHKGQSLRYVDVTQFLDDDIAASFLKLLEYVSEAVPTLKDSLKILEEGTVQNLQKQTLNSNTVEIGKGLMSSLVSGFNSFSAVVSVYSFIGGTFAGILTIFGGWYGYFISLVSFNIPDFVMLLFSPVIGLFYVWLYKKIKDILKF